MSTRVVALCLVVFLCAAWGSSASPTGVVLTVSTTADAVNGNVSSPAALIAKPGSDGISLREALLAAAKAAGRVGITFAPSLAGQTIEPTTFLPTITHDGTSLVGLTDDSGSPSVTLDATLNGSSCCSGLLAVFASDVTVSHLRVVGVHGDESAIAVRAGEPGGESSVHDVRVESNVLDNGGGFGVGIAIGTDFPGFLKRPAGFHYKGAVDASVVDATIAHNVVRGFTDDGVNVGLPGTGCTISGLVIEDNAFSENTGQGSPALELDPNYSGNTITGTRIVRNTFSGNWAGIGLNGGVAMPNGTPASGNVITGTEISQDDFTGNDQAIALNGGAGAASATGNSVTDTVIANDVLTSNAPFGAVGVIGGGQGASGNHIDGVLIVNDTMAFNDGAIGIIDDTDSSTSNQIADVTARNVIFWSNGTDIGGPDSSPSLPSIQSSLQDTNPAFVNDDDFRLTEGSPAIDAGTTQDAPTVDFEGRLRDGSPDIGAYEFGAATRPLLTVIVDPVGGTGSVTSSPSGIDCPAGECGAAYALGSVVTLTASPAPGSAFAGWSGGGCGVRQSCSTHVAANEDVTARFVPAVPLTPAKCAKPALCPHLSG